MKISHLPLVITALFCGSSADTLRVKLAPGGGAYVLITKK